MKKQLIAAAVAAAVAVPAAAQVSISGVLDVQAYNSREVQNVGGATVKDIGSGGASTDAANALDGYSTSAMTFTASEDLGGGLKATAVWMQRMSNTTYGERERYIDLAGNSGSIRFGRFNPSITAVFNTLSGLATTNNAGSFYSFVTDGGPTTLSASNVAFASGNFERQDNLMQITSADLSGFRISVGYANSSSDDSTIAGSVKAKQTYGTVSYARGSLEVGVALGKRDTETQEAAPFLNESDLKWLGAAYNLGFAKAHIMHAKRDQNINGNRVHDADLTSFAVSIPLGATTLRASFYEGSDDGAGANAVKNDGYQLSATYALSKRTFAYIVTGVNDKARSGASIAAEVETKQTGIGVSHSF